MENIIKIKEIELGKPDAKDEVLYSDSLEEFCDRIILPPSFDIDNIMKKDNCYIVGNKGVGKTALLFYINNLLLKEDALSVCSMILFKSGISASNRASMDKVEKIRISSMNIAKNELKYVRDFTKLWTLVIYKKIIKDNENGDIFEKNTNWESFEKLIKRLDDTQSEVLQFAKEIPEKSICFDSNQDAYIGGDKIEYPKDESNYSLAYFYEAVEFADKLFCSLTMKNHKYYICIDELEAYNGAYDIYIRDLTMIRDLIITTKRINSLLKQNKNPYVKIILSVRNEMVRSIMRELPGLEYNKDLGGFAEKIKWSAPIIDFIYHPLTSIWIKRIQETLNKKGESYTPNDIYINMFPQTIGVDKTINYVLERTWQKPRDIIRMMSCLHDEVGENECYYKANDFIKAMDEYSSQSKGELVEELGAVYSNNEIEKIFTSLTAYKKHFTREELRGRLEQYVIKHYANLKEKEIISDLYRVGIIGLRNFQTGQELWGYMGQAAVEDKEWRYIVHRGLWRELKLDSVAYEGILYTDIIGRMYACKVLGSDRNYLKLSFTYEGRSMRGIIHAKAITGRYTKIDKYIGKKIDAFVVGYDLKRKIWVLSKISNRML